MAARRRRILRAAARGRALKFCMVTTFYPPHAFGGDGVFVWRLSNCLAAAGHTVEVIHCLDSYRAVGGQTLPAGWDNHPNITLHSLQSGVGTLSPLATYFTGRPHFKSTRLRELLADGKFDVIHFHNISLVGGPAILAYGDALKLYTLHEHWLVCPTHVLYKFNREPCVKPSCFACTVAHGRPPQLWRYSDLLKRSLMHVDSFIAPSRFTRQRHQDAGINRPMAHLPHGLDAAWTTPSTMSRAEAKVPERPYFLFVGRLEKLKGAHTLIPHFLNQRAADLLIIGQGSEEAQLRQLAGDSTHIHFAGWRQGDLLKAAYAHAIATVVPSLTYETFGLVMVESFSQGTPAIVHDLGALPELIDASDSGMIFRNEHELGIALQTLLHNSALRNRMGEAGRRAFEERWTQERHLEGYMELIDGLQVGRQNSPTVVGAREKIGCTQ